MRPIDPSHDATHLGLDPDALSIEALAAAALSGAADPTVEIGGRHFRSAYDRTVDLSRLFTNPPPGKRTTVAIDVADPDGDPPPGAFARDDEIVRVTLPHLAIDDTTLDLRARHAVVLSEIGREHASRVFLKARASGPFRVVRPPARRRRVQPLRVFISYRRSDAAEAAHVLARALMSEFGESNVFLDAVTVPAGSDFGSLMTTAVADASAIVAVIGDRWTDGMAQQDDWVRLELEHALRSGTPIIPVLVGERLPMAQSELPSTVAPILERNALRLDPAAPEPGIRRLVAALRQLEAE